MHLLLIAIFALFGSICSVGFAAILLLFKGRRLAVLSGYLIPFAIGTLLSAAFFGMILRAMLQLKSSSALSAVLVGMILFYVLEKFAL